MRFLVLALVAGTASAADQCLYYEGDSVTLSGKVTLKTFYGPPNYGENPTTDSRETQALLILSTPICTSEGPGEKPDETNQTEITLVPLHNENLKQFVGKTIKVRGKVFHSHTGHHHTPVLIQIEQIEKPGA